LYSFIMLSFMHTLSHAYEFYDTTSVISKYFMRTYLEYLFVNSINNLICNVKHWLYTTEEAVTSPSDYKHFLL
jgi:hypothetical protein